MHVTVLSLQSFGTTHNYLHSVAYVSFHMHLPQVVTTWVQTRDLTFTMSSVLGHVNWLLCMYGIAQNPAIFNAIRMSGSEASYHDDDDDGAGVRGGGSVDDADANVDVGADADAAAAAHEEEVAHSLKKMGKIVNNLIARADSVPFREPGERYLGRTNHEERGLCGERRGGGGGATFILISLYICMYSYGPLTDPCFSSFVSEVDWKGLQVSFPLRVSRWQSCPLMV